MSPLSDPVLAVLDKCRWVHALGMADACEGCANDGDPEPCRGAGIGSVQDDPEELWCHCGHVVVMVEPPRECECDGPDGWHCEGEDSQHWAELDGATCGHCGWAPDPVALEAEEATRP